MNGESKSTPLYAWHCRQQAQLALFGGYHMPLWYASAKQEHLAVLSRAGLFDTSHMAMLTLQGPEARNLLQHCFTKDLERCIGGQSKPLYPGRCVYGAFLQENGHVLDDAIIFMLSEMDYVVIVNAGMGAPVARHLEKQGRRSDLTIRDWTDQMGKIDLQGPLSVRILRQALAEPDAVLDQMPYFSFKGSWPLAATAEAPAVEFKEGTAALVSRTGYTGEVGFEIFCAPERVQSIWELLLTLGRPLGAVPCGLAARDSLRTGAVLPLSHQDIGDWPYVNHPWRFALPLKKEGSGFTKAFIGDQALLQARNAAHTQPYVGFDPRKVDIQAAQVLDLDQQPRGTVLSCTTDMGMGRYEGRVYSLTSPDRPDGWEPRGLCCGFVKVDQPLTTGQVVWLEDKRRRIKVEIVDDIRPARSARRPLRTF